MTDQTPIATETAEAYAAPALTLARAHIARLVGDFRQHTGLPPSFVSAYARVGDAKWFANYRVQNFTFGTYDQVVQRMSAVWPDDLPWPAEVPRQAPAQDVSDLEIEWTRQMRARLAARDQEKANG